MPALLAALPFALVIVAKAVFGWRSANAGLLGLGGGPLLAVTASGSAPRCMAIWVRRQRPQGLWPKPR